MKNVLVLMLLLFAATASAEVFTFPAPRMGDVSFDHIFHRGKLKSCSVCHGEAPGKIHKVWTQQNGHDFCVDCHTRLDQGPLRCAGCHKKKPKQGTALAPAATTAAPVTGVQKPLSSAVFKGNTTAKPR